MNEKLQFCFIQSDNVWFDTEAFRIIYIELDAYSSFVYSL